MHYDVEAALHGKIELLAEEKRLPVPVPSPRFELLLRFRRRLVFVIVDARLSDRADVGQLCKLAELHQEVVCGLVHVKWVDANGRADHGVSVRKVHRSPATLERRADSDDFRYASTLRPGEDF